MPTGGQWRASGRPKANVTLSATGDWSPVAVKSVEDTRPIDWVSGRRLTGHGDAQPCDRCGKEHEVHVTVLGDDGREHRVGRTCAHASGPLASQLASVASATDRLAKPDAQLVALRQWQERYNAARAEAAEAFPGHEVRPNGHYVAHAGSVPGVDQEWVSLDGESRVLPVHTYRFGTEAIDEEETLRLLRSHWSHQKALAVAGPRPQVPDEAELLKRIGAVRRRLSSLIDRGHA